jgi:hypothetical protein
MLLVSIMQTFQRTMTSLYRGFVVCQEEIIKTGIKMDVTIITIYNIETV